MPTMPYLWAVGHCGIVPRTSYSLYSWYSAAVPVPVPVVIVLLFSHGVILYNEVNARKQPPYLYHINNDAYTVV